MPPTSLSPDMIAFLQAMAMQNCLNEHLAEPKWVTGHNLLRDDPSKWFRGNPIDDRDLALINASALPWIDIGKQSFLKHVVRANPLI